MVPEWAELAHQIGFDYVPRKDVSPGDGLRTDQLRGTLGGWQAKMDIYPRVGSGIQHQTRFIVPCAQRTPFRFRVRQGSTGDALATAVGRGKDIEIGDATFDVSFVVTGSDEAAIRSLLADPELRRTFPRVPPAFMVEVTGADVAAHDAVLICWVSDLLVTREKVTPWLTLVERVLERLAEVRLIDPP